MNDLVKAILAIIIVVACVAATFASISGYFELSAGEAAAAGTFTGWLIGEARAILGNYFRKDTGV